MKFWGKNYEKVKLCTSQMAVFIIFITSIAEGENIDYKQLSPLSHLNQFSEWLKVTMDAILM